MPFPEFVKREIKAKKILLTLTIELNNCSRTAVELEERLNRISESYNNSQQSNAFSEFVIMLIRESRASTWDAANITAKEIADA